MSPEADDLAPELDAIDQDIDTAPAPSPAAPPADPCEPILGESPKDALTRLDLCLKARQDAKDAAENDAANAQEQISAIKQTVDELEKLTDDYDAAYPDLNKTHEDFRKYRNEEKDSLAAILDEKAPVIARVVSQFHAHLDRLKADATILKDRVTYWTGQVSERARDRDARKNELDAWKQLIGQIGLAHNELETLKGAISDAKGAGDFAIAYWLLTDAGKFAGIIDSKDWPNKEKTWARPILPSDYPGKLDNAVIQYSLAIGHLQEAEDKLKAAQGALEAKNAKVKEYEDALEEHIRAALKAIKP